MLIKIIEYHSTEIPSLAEIKECIEVARQNNATIKLRFFVKGSGCYDAFITATDSAEKIDELIKPYRSVTNRLQERFGLHYD